MTTPQNTVMPLEEVKRRIHQLRLSELVSPDEYDSILHHLEAGRVCECRSMQIAIAAGSLPLRNGIPSVAECYIQFCPWCGGKVSHSTLQPVEEVKEEPC